MSRDFPISPHGPFFTYITLPYRWALKDAIDLVAYSEAPDLLQDIQY